MEIVRICEYCKKDFVAKRLATKCCSDYCSKMFYKQRRKNEKIKNAEKSVSVQRAGFDMERLQEKEYLTVNETLFLLGISRTTLYRMIKDGRLAKLEPVRSVRIARKDIDSLFKKRKSEKEAEQYVAPVFSKENYFTINEALEHTQMSSGSFYNLCKKHAIPKIPMGKFVYVPKDLINKIFQL